MKKIFLALFIGLMMIQISGCSKSEEAPAYYGTWEVMAAEPSPASDPSIICALSQDEISALLGTRLFYSEDSFRFNEEERTITGYDSENVAYTCETFEEDYHLNLGEWWNEKNQVMFFEISSEDDFFGRQFFVADEETIWIPYEGAVFLAKRAPF